MYRLLIYLFAIADMSLGFLIMYRNSRRFGFLTYRSYLERETRDPEEM